jgi:hypothetical protein
VTVELQRAVLDEIADLLQPLARAAEDPRVLAVLLEELGWHPDLIGISNDSLMKGLGSAKKAVDELSALVEKGPTNLLDLTSTLEMAGEAVRGLAAIDRGRSPPADLTDDLLSLFVDDLLLFLVERNLLLRVPLTNAILDLTGVLSTAPASEKLADNRVVRRAQVRPVLDLSVIGRTLSDPVGLLRDRWLMDGSSPRNADDLADHLGPVLSELLTRVGVLAVYGTLAVANDPPLSPDELVAASRFLRIVLAYDLDSGERAVFLLTLAVVDDKSGLTLVAVPRGTIDVTHRSDSWAFGVKLTGSVGLIAINRAGVYFHDPTNKELKIAASFKRDPATDGTAILMLGSSTGTHFQLAGIEASATLDATPEGVSLGASVTLDGASLTIAAGDGDGFLRSVLPSKPIVVDLPLAFDWSPKNGLRVRGAPALEITLPVHLSAGPLTLYAITLALRARETVEFELSAAMSFRLGPCTASADRLGIGIELEQRSGSIGPADLSIGFKPPDGIGLSIDAGPVSGGGLLVHRDGVYAGVASLAFADFGVDAVGLLATKMPDGSALPAPGWSLLLVVTGELRVQLGFGFTLNRVGGLLGIHRSAAVDALRAGARTGSLGEVMFPAAPETSGLQLFSALEEFFPVTPERHIFGPMVQIGWGPGTASFVTLDVALLFELPAPLRLIIVGLLRVVLPDEDKAIVKLKMDALGVIDFEREEVSIDASLYESSIAGFPLTGDMAMRMCWGAHASFALSVGGFHPRFTPPAGFPALRRVAISLAEGSNLRIRLEGYLALTAATVQFGARLELYAGLGEFSVNGLFYFDALFQFAPRFGFMVDLGAGVTVRYGSTELVSIRLDLSLSGTSPWDARGTARIKILFISISGHFHETWGDDPGLQAPQTIDVGKLLRDELSDPRAWSAQLPAGGASLVSLRRIEPKAGELLAHPLGTIGFTQRVVPLNMTITRYGNALLTPGTGSRFTLAKAWYVSSGSGARIELDDATRVPIWEQFALTDFLELTEDEKLSGSAFEPKEAGQLFGYPKKLPRDDGPLAARAMVLGYEEKYVREDPKYVKENVPDEDGRTVAAKKAPRVLAGARLVRLLPRGAAARAMRGGSRAALRASAGPRLEVVVLKQKYEISVKDVVLGEGSYADVLTAIPRRRDREWRARIAPYKEKVST